MSFFSILTEEFIWNRIPAQDAPPPIDSRGTSLFLGIFAIFSWFYPPVQIILGASAALSAWLSRKEHHFTGCRNCRIRYRNFLHSAELFYLFPVYAGLPCSPGSRQRRPDPSGLPPGSGNSKPHGNDSAVSCQQPYFRQNARQHQRMLPGIFYAFLIFYFRTPHGFSGGSSRFSQTQQRSLRMLLHSFHRSAARIHRSDFQALQSRPPPNAAAAACSSSAPFPSTRTK